MVNIELILSYGWKDSYGNYHSHDDFTMNSGEKINDLLDGFASDDAASYVQLTLSVNGAREVIGEFKKIKLKGKSYKWIAL